MSLDIMVSADIASEPGDIRTFNLSPGTKFQKQQRRRQIDPSTCEREYSNDELEFMRAMDAYKRASGRMFPTCSEILEVLRKLGYSKTPA